MQLDELVISNTPHVTALEVGENALQLFIREGGATRTRSVPWRPFLLIDAPEHLYGFEHDFETGALQGEMVLKYRISFPNVAVYREAVEFLKGVKGAIYSSFRDLRQQALTATGIRLFSDMQFPQLRRLAFQLTLDDSGCIREISLADSDGRRETFSGDDEKLLLARMIETIRRYDPDVLLTHNGSRRDWPLLETRAKKCRVKLELGRDQSIPFHRPSRFAIADRVISYNRYEVYGRHVIDTLHLAQFHDASSRDIDSFELEGLAEYFHLREKSGAAAVIELGNLLEPSYFYQCALLPLSYQELIVRGNGTSLDALFVAEYLRNNHSLPLPEAPRRFAGALTRADRTGVFRNVWHCDVRSLYPSIILAEGWVPARDELGEFPRLLAALRRFRLEAKDRFRHAAEPGERAYYQALQSTFKITINSFYGYLGFAQGTFNDYDMAEHVTTRGREILTGMVDFLTASGAEVIEMDTDGIYFQPPVACGEPAEFQRRIQAALPEGIDVELNAVYPAMFSYKSKNYAVLAPDGAVEITGAALKSRGLEPFQRTLLAEIITALLHGRGAEIPALCNAMRDRIRERQLPLSMLAKTETLNDSPANYKRKLENGSGRRSAAYELALRSGEDLRSGDQVSYYLTGDKAKVSVVDNAKLLRDAGTSRDENIAWYLAKVDELEKNFQPFLD